MHDDEAPEPTPPAEGSPPPVRGKSLPEIASEFWRRRAGANVPRNPTPASNSKAIVDGLDRLEQGLGLASVVFAILLAVVGFLASRHSTTKSVHDAANFFLISNLVFAAILAIGLALKRRALLGFGCFFIGLEQAFSYHSVGLGLPFLALGGWLIMRASKKQKLERGTAAARKDAPAKRSSAPPKASKRYTPPRRTASSHRR